MSQDWTESTRKRPSGRRVGDSGTRDAILDAARDLFADRGYDGASIRAIAERAGVDPALIRHFFGDKQALFATTVADRTVIPRILAAALQGDSESAGMRAADAYLRVWEDPATRPILMALVKSATTSPEAARLLREILGSRAPGVDAIDDERQRRVALAASQLLGIAIGRYVMELPVISKIDLNTLVAEVAPTIQRYLDGTHQ